MRKYDDFSIGEYFIKQGAEVGSDNRIMIRSLGESPFLVKIGNHCTISSEVNLITHDGSGWIFNEEIVGLQRFGTIQILDNCFIGMRSTILPNVKIGPNSVVGACSVVTRDVPANSVVAGNPARVINDIEALKRKLITLWKEQRPLNYLSEFNGISKYSPRFIENEKKRDMKILQKHLISLFWNDHQDK